MIICPYERIVSVYLVTLLQPDETAQEMRWANPTKLTNHV
jgi:hypothetical protein